VTSRSQVLIDSVIHSHVASVPSLTWPDMTAPDLNSGSSAARSIKAAPFSILAQDLSLTSARIYCHPDYLVTALIWNSAPSLH
jgi:hypothetical protein